MNRIGNFDLVCVFVFSFSYFFCSLFFYSILLRYLRVVLQLVMAVLTSRLCGLNVISFWMKIFSNQFGALWLTELHNLFKLIKKKKNTASYSCKVSDCDWLKWLCDCDCVKVHKNILLYIFIKYPITIDFIHSFIHSSIPFKRWNDQFYIYKIKKQFYDFILNRNRL